MIKHFVLDVDGVFTTGQFLYTSEGKFAKVFGPHDADGIKLIRGKLSVEAITGDKRGYPITKKRIQDDMGIKLTVVTEQERLKFFQDNYQWEECIYMGDGLFDVPVLARVAYGIAPANAVPQAKAAAQYVTQARGGEGAVAEACWHVMEKFFGLPDTANMTYDSKAQVWR